MSTRSESRLIRPLAKGQITIPVNMRRALGIGETTLPQIRLEGDDIVISKLPEPGPTARLYTDEEIEAFLAEDVLTPAEAEWVQQMLVGLR